MFRHDNQVVEIRDHTRVEDKVPTCLLCLTVISLILASFIPYASNAQPGQFYKPDITNGLICMFFFIVGLVRQAVRDRSSDVVKRALKEIDYYTIFLLIAGTYTPITLYYLNGVTGWILFGIVWASAIFGIVMNSINLEKARIPSIFCYIGMGWVIIFAIKPLMEHMPSISGIFLIIGGVFYTVGIIFYAIKKVKYFHSIWHLFTVAGSVFHYFAILLGFFRI